MKVIGLVGKKRSGKDTVNEMIQETIHSTEVPQAIGHVRFAFADELKVEVSNALKVPKSTIELNKEVFRPILQWWAHEFRKKWQGNPNYWIDVVIGGIRKDFVGYPFVVVITDVRYLDEALALREAFKGNIELWRIDRPSINLIVMEDKDATTLHPSETEQETIVCDRTIVNSGSIDDLKYRVKSKFSDFMLKYKYKI